LRDYEYVEKLAKAGFDNIDIEATRVYKRKAALPATDAGPWADEPAKKQTGSSGRLSQAESGTPLQPLGN
jgi:hypothetical protein